MVDTSVPEDDRVDPQPGSAPDEPESEAPGEDDAEAGATELAELSADRTLTDGADEEPEPPLGLDPAAALEAVLLASDEPLNSGRLAQLVDLPDGTQVRKVIRQLNEAYWQQGRAFAIEEMAGGFQMLTRPEFARYLRRLHQSNAAARLSNAALETLAIVAYRQPVLRADVEAIRGVESGEMLRQLMEKGMVRIAGRMEALGRPFLYATTRQFLQRFGVRSLKDLPMVEELRIPVGQSAGGGGPTQPAPSPADQSPGETPDSPDGADEGAPGTDEAGSTPITS